MSKVEGVEGTEGVEGDSRHLNVLYYKDVYLLVVHSPNNSKRDVLTIEVKLSHYKGHNKYPKPLVN